MGVFTDRDENGDLITDSLLGLEVKGGITYNADVKIGTEDRYVIYLCSRTIRVLASILVYNAKDPYTMAIIVK